jgi:hypothetical protein
MGRSHCCRLTHVPSFGLILNLTANLHTAKMTITAVRDINAYCLMQAVAKIWLALHIVMNHPKVGILGNN